MKKKVQINMSIIERQPKLEFYCALFAGAITFKLYIYKVITYIARVRDSKG